jgi:hypothetical protein
MQRRARGTFDYRPLFRVFHAWANMAGWSPMDGEMDPRRKQATHGGPGWGILWQSDGFEMPPPLCALVSVPPDHDESGAAFPNAARACESFTVLARRARRALAKRRWKNKKMAR